MNKRKIRTGNVWGGVPTADGGQSSFEICGGGNYLLCFQTTFDTKSLIAHVYAKPNSLQVGAQKVVRQRYSCWIQRPSAQG